jgi:hypothetical protein
MDRRDPAVFADRVGYITGMGETGMKKPLTMASAALLALSISAASVSAADVSTETPVTRGQFIKQVADYLQLSPQNGGASLPSDISAQSPYAGPVQALIERQIIDGYPDGTFRPDQPITSPEAGYILARFLGFEDAAALERLEEKFGIRFDNAAIVLPDAAQQAIRTSLASDSKIREWLKQSSIKQTELKSFRVDMEQNMKIRLAPGQAETAGMETTVRSASLFDLAKGMHMSMSMSVPGEANSMELEQYIVPGGSYMRLPDAATGGASWVNTTKQMPFTFEQLLQLQKDSVSLNQSLMNNAFFYRDLGTEQLDGRTMKKIEINGKLHDLKQIWSALGSAMNDQSMLQSLADSADLQNMSLSMNGTMWVDEATQLTAKMETAMSIRYGASETMPLEGMDMTVAAVYKDFNEPVEIVLPETAKNAPEMTAQLPAAEAEHANPAAAADASH